MASVYSSIAEKWYHEGEEKGIAKGVVKGMAKGKADRNIEIAKKMLVKGLDVTLISSVTGLDKSFIRNLKNL